LGNVIENCPVLNIELCPPAAFHKETLGNPRWYLGSTRQGALGPWIELTRVTDDAQFLLMQRVLFLHGKSAARKARNSRLSLTDWLNDSWLVILIELLRFET